MAVRHSSLIGTILFINMSLTAFAFSQAQPSYQTETWEPGRALVWAHPGRGGALNDPNNWRSADGAPVKVAPDRTTDVLLPTAMEPYTVSGARTDQVRHVAIEKNAMLAGTHRNEVEIWGNCHVKAGGYVKYISIRGDKHSFFRIDDSEYPSPENGQILHHPGRRVEFAQLSRSHIGHKFQVCKFGAASVEFLGKLGVSDEVMVQHGKMIVSGEFRYSGVTGKGALEIYDGAILELQSGARIAPFVPDNRKGVYNVNIYRNGVLQAGSPERPLTRDAFLMLGFAENDQPGRTGLYAALGSMMRVYTTDPARARLVVTAMTSDPDFRDAQGKCIGNPDERAEGKKGIAMQLAGDIQLDGVHFDYVSSGGIGLVGAAQPAAWTHVTWGPHCAGPNQALFSELAANPNAYYHQRGDQQSEYALTTRAVALMQEYLEQTDPFRLTTVPPNTQLVEVGASKSKIKTPVAVVFHEPIEVAIETRVPGAKIRYTLDGTEPTKDSPVHEQPIRLSKTTKITAKAYKPGVGFSSVFSTTYVFE